jgi:nucleolar pre-ribosomal-associated protein 1
MSAFTVFLKLSSGGVEGIASERLEKILESVAIDQLVLATTGLRAIYQSFAGLKTSKLPPESAWTLLDLGITKCATNMLKCLALAPLYLGSVYQPGSNFLVSPVIVAIAEQLSFWAHKPNPEIDYKVVSEFLAKYVSHSVRLGESVEWMNCLTGHMNNMVPLDCRISLPVPDGPSVQSCLQDGADSNRLLQPKMNHSQSMVLAEADAATIGQESLEEMLHEPHPMSLDNAALTRWMMKSVDDVIDDEHAILLIRLLLSEHTSIRKEALTNLLKLATKVYESSYSEKVQIWLLLSELVESSKDLVDDGPVPSAFVALAVHALPILANPLHPVYAKINKFLMKAPSWSAVKIPLLHGVLHEAPTDEGTFYAERAWLFPFLLDCLQTTVDLEVFRRSGCFEEICTEISNPYMKAGLRARVSKILYRATCIDGGSTTLVTRFGIMSWLEMQRHDYFLTKEERLVVAALKERVWKTCDQERISKWSHGSIPAMMASEVEIGSR